MLMALVESALFPPSDPHVTYADNFSDPNVTGAINGAGYRIAGPVELLPIAPIPEIITIVLLAIGLLAIGVYVWYRRSRGLAFS